MAKNVTLSDIASAAGVSNVAVHKALNDKPGVSEDLRKTIKQLAMEMGYTSSGSTKKPSERSRTGNIGVMVPEKYYGYSVTFYGQLYEQVVKALYAYKYYGILELLELEDIMNLRLPKVVQDKKVDGLIILGQVSREYADFLLNHVKLPIIFLDSCLPGRAIDTVVSDGFYGTYMLTNYLIELGHRKIGFVGSVDMTSSIADRYWGYRKSLRENGIPFQNEWEFPDRDSLGSMLEPILEKPAGLDALVCNCDITALSVIQSLEANGFRIPEDLSIVGFDDFLLRGAGENFITSYRVEMEVMAKRCVKTLLKKIDGEPYAKGVQIITGEMICRNTVKDRNK